MRVERPIGGTPYTVFSDGEEVWIEHQAAPGRRYYVKPSSDCPETEVANVCRGIERMCSPNSLDLGSYATILLIVMPASLVGMVWALCGPVIGVVTMFLLISWSWRR